MRPVLAVALLVAACSPDLPPGWENAESLPITQKPCVGSALDEDAPKESVKVTRTGTTLALAYDAAHFRCAQDVEGFLKRDGATASVLVQPVDMNPSSVAKCDCLYDVTASVPSADGLTSVEVFRRWDHVNADTTPVKVGTATP